MTAMMFGEGLAYFFILTLLNVANIILFRSDNVAQQTSGASLAQVATMILSERFILNLHKRYQNETRPNMGVTGVESAFSVRTDNMPRNSVLSPKRDARPLSFPAQQNVYPYAESFMADGDKFA